MHSLSHCQRPLPQWYTCYNPEHCHHPQSTFTLGFTLGAVPSMDVDKCITACVHHYSIVQNSFTALKIICAPPIHPSFPPNFWQPQNHRSFYCLHSFAFSRMSYSWNHTVYSLFRLAFFNL